MKIRFKLNTALRSVGRIKGWNCTSDLRKTVASVSDENKTALIAAIKAEIIKAELAFERAESDIRSPFARQGTRFGKNAGARYNRAFDKIKELKGALEELSL